MCCFSGRVQEVSGTRIFARSSGKDLQILAYSMSVSADADLDSAMREALDSPGTVVLDVHVRREENCYPMIPAGAAARDMVG